MFESETILLVEDIVVRDTGYIFKNHYIPPVVAVQDTPEVSRVQLSLLLLCCFKTSEKLRRQ